MPELPEVETIKSILIPVVKGRKIINVDVYRDKTIEGNVKEFKDTLKGKRFLDVSRIGKYLIFHLEDDVVFVSHLRMEGKYYSFKEEESDSKYAKVVFHFDDGSKLCYDDSRAFGIMKLSNEKEYRNLEMLAKLGPEPFDVSDVSLLMKKTKKINKPIKTTLLDQTLITGLGNIYVDETLYASNIHPLTPANKLSKTDWENVIKNSKEILKIAIEMGGSTIKSYHPGKDIDGNFQTRIKIYGKSGEICPICQHEFRFIKVGGRGTTFCPTCQRKHGEPINIAITGKIASGKSKALDLFKSLGAITISSDDIVKELYNDEKVTSLIEKSLQIKFSTPIVNKDELRNAIILDSKKKRKLEKIIHPLVEKKIAEFLKVEINPIRVVEVPLLFESNLDRYFDTIVVIDVSEKTQLERLEKRNKATAMHLFEINKTNKIDINKNKATYLVNNDCSDKELEKQIKRIFNEAKDLL